MSLESWRDAVRGAERRGELLEAVDLAERGLEEYPNDSELRYRSVLALARSGSTGEAERRYAEYGLSEIASEDAAALAARIAKDKALATEGDERTALASEAADAYGAVYGRTRGFFPGINAATMTLLAGDPSSARKLAREVLDSLSHEERSSYWGAATEAEAQLLLGESAEAWEAIDRAAALNEGDYGALASTRKQLRLICAELGIGEENLSGLSGPAVAHFCGHRIADAGAEGRFKAEDEPAVAEAIAAEVERYPVGFAYGSLASGADILWAEALLERGTELHVVLPYEREEFVEISVAPSGAGWVERFDGCIERARDVRFAVDDAYLGDDVLYRYGSEFAMGLALLRGTYLDAEVRQFAVWDGGPAAGAAGTAIDVERWRGTQNPLSIVPVGSPGAASATAPRGGSENRVVRAMLFADVRGFSRLTDPQLPAFADHVLGGFARVLERYRDAVEHQNTWGDALYVVLPDAEIAARCALDLCAVMGRLDLGALGLPEHLALRLGAHVGPVFPIQDPVIERAAFMGSHVSRTARIEPVTPPGTVYVTEPLAASLALAGTSELHCEYVGHMPAAKDYGLLRMHRLWSSRA